MYNIDILHTGTKWELILCETCGSSATHTVCSKLRKRDKEWLCKLCSKYPSSSASPAISTRSITSPAVSTRGITSPVVSTPAARATHRHVSAGKLLLCCPMFAKLSPGLKGRNYKLNVK